VRLLSMCGLCATIDRMRVLVVDDDRAVRDALRRVLTLDGYDVQSAEGGAEAIEAVAQSVPDAVVLDIGMPGIDGIEVCERVRLLGNRVPILMLTARVEISDRVAGLDAGADDYLIKPFDVNELKARLRALLRRSGPESEPDELSFAEVKLDRALHGASVGEQFAELTRTEYQLLELFMRNPRQVLPHSVIYDRVWGYDFGPASNALRVYVGYLRRKLQELGARDLLHTVRGVGYVMREP
jgi:two-component system response regulator MprA